jgi:hypothetical protein
MTHPFTVEVSRSEYDTGKGNWQKMPETMIKKVAESQCLRRAFDISGLYDQSEYDPADNFQGQGHQNAQETILVEQEPIRPRPTPDMPARPVTTSTPKAAPAQASQPTKRKHHPGKWQLPNKGRGFLNLPVTRAWKRSKLTGG